MDGNVGGPCRTFSIVSLNAASSDAESSDPDWLESCVVVWGAWCTTGTWLFGPSWSIWKSVSRNVPRTGNKKVEGLRLRDMFPERIFTLVKLNMFVPPFGQINHLINQLWQHFLEIFLNSSRPLCQLAKSILGAIQIWIKTVSCLSTHHAWAHTPFNPHLRCWKYSIVYWKNMSWYKKKQVELGFSRSIKYVPTEFRFDLYIKVKGQTKVKVMWHVWDTQWSVSPKLVMSSGQCTAGLTC